jgi:hypothetical protein
MNGVVHAAQTGDLPEGFGRPRRPIVEQQHSGVQPGSRLPDAEVASHIKPSIDRNLCEIILPPHFSEKLVL